MFLEKLPLLQQQVITHAPLNKITVVDLFSGCGGFTLGLQKAGFEVVVACDNWTQAVDIYKKNFQHDIFLEDISDENKIMSIIRNYNPNMIVGGPPCQDFSHAGNRLEASRANLTISYANIINNYKPEWFIMENVDRIQKTNTYKNAKDIFQKAGYGLTERVLDASLCGVPQKRKRFFCIGHKYSEHEFLNPIIDSVLSEKAMTLKDYFKDELDLEYYYRHPRNYSRRGIFSVNEPSPTIRGVNRPIPSNYQKHSSDAVNPHDNNIRPLTTLERARIQTFPKDFIFEGTKTHLEQMIGNAVPVNLAEFIAKAINIYKLSC